MENAQEKAAKPKTTGETLRRHGMTILLFSPLVVALGGLFLPRGAIVYLVLMLCGIGAFKFLLFKKVGLKNLWGQSKKAYGGGEIAAFVKNYALVIGLMVLGWSSSFWGSGVSSRVAGLLSSIPGSEEVESALAGRNVIILPILALLGHFVFQSVLRYRDAFAARKRAGGLIRLLVCLSPGVTALIPFMANRVDSVFWLVIYISLIGAALVLLGLRCDTRGLLRHVWRGRTGKSLLGANMAVVIVLLAVVTLTGKLINQYAFRAFDSLAQTTLAKTLGELNIPLYFFAALQLLLTLLLVASRLRGGLARAGGQGDILLRKEDGTIVYSADMGSKRSATEEVAQMLLIGVRERASDIHLEPGPEGLLSRFRVDGLLHKKDNFDLDSGKHIVSSIKVMANMDIAERRKPQDGRFSGNVDGNFVDFRVSSSPTGYGENIVIRILNQSEGLIRLDELGFNPDQIQPWKALVRRPHGITIVCGPTGSGKTTTIYATISFMDVEQLNVITIEEPIEYNLIGVTQTIINEKQNLTFANALRSILRQDPDVIFVGEIRDSETAKIAMQASLTGHLVLTTVHATDVCSCLLRLMDLGVNDKSIISFSAILSQRLVRKLCVNCKEPEPTSEYETGVLRQFGPVPAELYKPRGCPACNGTGYRGRAGVFELLIIKDWIRDLFLTEHTPGDIRRKLNEQGFTSIWVNGMKKIAGGITTLDELERVAVPED